MVRVDVITTAGAVLTGLAINARFASADSLANRMRALATTTSTSDTACTAEYQACGADAVCLPCTQAYAAQIGGCQESLTGTTGSDGYDPCLVAEDLMCCAASGCEDNALFGAVIDCAAQLDAEYGCGFIDIRACSGGSGGVVSSDPGLTDADSTTAKDDDTSATAGDRGISTADSTTATDDASATPSSACQAEEDACQADAECFSCIQAESVEDQAVVDSCRGPVSNEAPTCPEIMEVGCCNVESRECLVTNAAAAVLLDCFAAAEGCEFSLTDCIDGGDSSTLMGGGDDDSPATTASDRGITTADSATAADDASATTSSACQAEQEACQADQECVSCADALAAEEDAVAATCEGPDYDVDTATCAERLDVGCCQVEEAPECMVTNDAMSALLDCLVVASGCDFSISDCTGDGDNSSLSAEGGDDETSEGSGDSFPLLGGDDDEAEGVEADEDGEGADADAAEAGDTDSATPFAVTGGGTTAVFVGLAVSLAFVNA